MRKKKAAQPEGAAAEEKLTARRGGGAAAGGTAKKEVRAGGELEAAALEVGGEQEAPETLEQAARKILAAPPEQVLPELTEQEGADLRRDVQSALLVRMAQDGVRGSQKAAEYLLKFAADGTGSGEIGYLGIPAEKIGKAYTEVYHRILARSHRYYDFKGGRGSLKSSFCALVMVDMLMRHPKMCAIVLRQVKDTLKDSVFAQISWAVDELGVTHFFKFTENPMKIMRVDTKQVIYFRGADDPVKIKSIKPPKGMYIGAVWFEEKDQFRGENAVRSILQSVLRGGDDGIVLASYNTPMSRQHFLNKADYALNEKRLIHHSYYYDAPRHWLGEPFFEQAEELKRVNPKAYGHEYLGEAIGIGGAVFENLEIRAITEEEVGGFDRNYFGIDWGWYPDPTAFTKCYYNAARRELFIYDEFIAFKTNNIGICKLLEEHGVGKEDMVICDNSDNKAIGDLKAHGFYALATEKGPGSVLWRMKWLQGLTRIVIDPARCPHCADEFLSYEYERTKDGEVISSYPDRNNHFIDSVGYGLNMVWRRKGQ